MGCVVLSSDGPSPAQLNLSPPLALCAWSSQPGGLTKLRGFLRLQWLLVLTRASLKIIISPIMKAPWARLSVTQAIDIALLGTTVTEGAGGRGFSLGDFSTAPRR